ncbi:MAG: hypothetical protein WC339_05360 [Candidatus Izemoplasmatales bacterium]|jgi:hypothetical protein|nr:hypothetical protein [Candidatus Izemoplasmatales bacterium]MDD4987446.1 hypothetical protein [Candidatus Izemoplasmatales bacterium]MDY0373497.1 hypothetical protein [Candidatus Izemoplasmatales bacterium]NLF48801.1 hypothetical protein [Acholeplasmataceae bacterium]
MSKKSMNNDGEKRQNPYLIDKLAKIPAWLKIEFLKFWAVGMAFYLTFFGLPVRFDYLDRMVVFALILILAMEYLVIPVIYFMGHEEHPTDFYLPHHIKRKSILSFLGSALYVAIIVTLSHFIVTWWVKLGFKTIGDVLTESPADPFTFAFLFLILDLAWLFLRYFIHKLRVKKG